MVILQQKLGFYHMIQQIAWEFGELVDECNLSFEMICLQYFILFWQCFPLECRFMAKNKWKKKVLNGKKDSFFIILYTPIFIFRFTS